MKIYATMKALHKCVCELHPKINEIILAVNEGNIAAQRLYLKMGFQLILHHRIT